MPDTPKTDRTLKTIHGVYAIVTAVEGTTDGNVGLVLRCPNTDAVLRFYLDRESAERLAVYVPQVLGAIDARNN